MRWLCDRMLERLARWLRAAGHDAASAPPGASDAELLELARREDRTLLTRTRALAAAAGELGLLLEGDGPEAEALDLGRKRRIDWSMAPFTRCLMDNAVLEPATAQDIAHMPEKAQRLDGPFRVCPLCGRLYWPGSHVKRMARKLERFAEAQGEARTGGHGAPPQAGA